MRLVDTRMVATHDAGETNGLLVVRDHEHRVIHRDVAPVEKSQRFARARAAHDDAAIDFAPVIGVHRLAELEHHVVRDVDDRVDRTQTRASQPFPHPEGRLRPRRSDRGSARGEARAARPGCQLDLHRVGAAGNGRVDFRNYEGLTGQRRDLARYAEHAHAVTAVRGQVEAENYVVERERVASGCPVGSSAGNSSRPAASSDRPSSRAEHSMPDESSPRSLALLDHGPPGSVAPIVASGAFMPARTFGAPQTTCRVSLPVATWQSVRLSAFG